MPSAKWRPFCVDLNMLNASLGNMRWQLRPQRTLFYHDTAVCISRVFWLVKRQTKWGKYCHILRVFALSFFLGNIIDWVQFWVPGNCSGRVDLTMHFYVVSWKYRLWLHTMRPRQNGRHFADDVLNLILLHFHWHLILRVRLAVTLSKVNGPTWGPSGADRTQVGPMLAPWTLLSGKLSFDRVMTWCREGDKPLLETMLAKSYDPI